MRQSASYIFFFFNDTATTEIYTLSLHDALPIFLDGIGLAFGTNKIGIARPLFVIIEQPVREAINEYNDIQDKKFMEAAKKEDRKSTRLNSSHQIISYAVFCLKKKIKRPESDTRP